MEKSMNLWQRIKNLWEISETGQAWQTPFQSVEPISRSDWDKATIIPYQKIDPIKKITEEHAKN